MNIIEINSLNKYTRNTEMLTKLNKKLMMVWQKMQLSGLKDFYLKTMNDNIFYF